MKQVFLIICLAFFAIQMQAIDPIKKKKFYISFDASIPFYQYYTQVSFAKKGFSLGGAINIGHRSFPIYAEYFYQSPLVFEYRNNKVEETYQELGLRYNLNRVSYILPYGVDPYIGAGLIKRSATFTQVSLNNTEGQDILNQQSSQTFNYKLTAGVKVGNNNVTFGLQYDFLPAKFNVPNAEGDGFTIYNTIHMVSARIGVRLFAMNTNKIRCPRFKTKQKRTLSF